MRVLVAEDEPTTARVVGGLLEADGWTVLTAADGPSALSTLTSADPPEIALLDWMLPGGIDGLQICETVRARPGGPATYLVLLTSRSEVADVVRGLDAGADDYLVKPCNPAELRARLHAGARTMNLQRTLAQKARELEEAVDRAKTLSGLLPICGKCMAIREDGAYWRKVEDYLSDYSDAQFTHGVCPRCLERLMQ